MTTKTIEFYEPEHGLEIEPYIETENKQGIHHLGRYQWARRVLRDLEVKTLLDIACGVGYGSYLLAEALPSTFVTGADYDDRAVDRANESYAAENLRYVQGDMVTWQRIDPSLPLGQFDAIASFDTIEHLMHREVALLRMAENLTDDGVLLLSTPCHRLPILNPGWEHHKIEYSFADLYGMLCRFFHDVRFPENRSLPHLDFWENVINKDRQRYLNRMNPVVCQKPIRLETSYEKVSAQ